MRTAHRLALLLAPDLRLVLDGLDRATAYLTDALGDRGLVSDEDELVASALVEVEVSATVLRGDLPAQRFARALRG